MFPYNSIISKKDISKWNQGEKPKSNRTFFFLLRGNTKGREPTVLGLGGVAGTSPQNLALSMMHRLYVIPATCLSE